VDDVLAVQDANPSFSAAETTTETVSPTSAAAKASSSGIHHKSCKEELEQLKQMRSCKKCFQTEASVVFLACGHLAVCRNCSTKSSMCPICKSTIRETIDSYIV